jgi:hypothetical protein
VITPPPSLPAPVLPPPTIIVNTDQSPAPNMPGSCTLPTAADIANAIKQVATPDVFFTPTRQLVSNGKGGFIGVEQNINSSGFPTQLGNRGSYERGGSYEAANYFGLSNTATYVAIGIVILLIIGIAIALYLYINSNSNSKKDENKDENIQ